MRRRRSRGASRRGAPDDRGAVRVARRPVRGRGRPSACWCWTPRPADQRRIVHRRVRRGHQADGGRRSDRQAADAAPRSLAGPSRMHGSDFGVTRPRATTSRSRSVDRSLYGGQSSAEGGPAVPRRRPRTGNNGMLSPSRAVTPTACADDGAGRRREGSSSAHGRPGEPVVHRAVPAAVLGPQGQLDHQRDDDDRSTPGLSRRELRTLHQLERAGRGTGERVAGTSDGSRGGSNSTAGRFATAPQPPLSGDRTRPSRW
jgi:hypothetical protein